MFTKCSTWLQSVPINVRNKDTTFQLPEIHESNDVRFNLYYAQSYMVLCVYLLIQNCVPKVLVSAFVVVAVPGPGFQARGYSVNP